MIPRGDAETVSLIEKYEELREKYRRLEKEHKSLQVEHSRLLFDMDAVIEHEVDVKCKKLREENKKLKEKIKRLEFDVDAWHQLKLLLEGEIKRLLGLQICGKTVAERIEDDKKVVRE